MSNFEQMRDQFRKLESTIDKIDELNLNTNTIDTLCELYDTLVESIVDICRIADVSIDDERARLDEVMDESEEAEDLYDYLDEFRDRVYGALKDSLFCNIFDIK